MQVADVAKRLECARFSGALVRAEDLYRWMIFVRVESGAEVTAVQTLREQGGAVAEHEEVKTKADWTRWGR